MAIIGLGHLQGKSCVVTGAAFGIGRASAELCAREGAGLIVTDIQEAPLLAFRDDLHLTGAILPVDGSYLAQ